VKQATATPDALDDLLEESIRSAETFVHLSYFELFPNRMGHIVAGLLIAKRLGSHTPCDIDRVLNTLGVPRVLNGHECADVPVVTGAIASEEFAVPGKDTLLANVAVLESRYPDRSPVVIKLYLDDFKQLERKLTGAGIIQALNAFGIHVHKEAAALMWGSNHTKALGTIISRAQQSLYFENAFFSDGLSALLIRGKARQWQLRKAKERN